MINSQLVIINLCISGYHRMHLYQNWGTDTYPADQILGLAISSNCTPAKSRALGMMHKQWYKCVKEINALYFEFLTVIVTSKSSENILEFGLTFAMKKYI